MVMADFGNSQDSSARRAAAVFAGWLATTHPGVAGKRMRRRDAWPEIQQFKWRKLTGVNWQNLNRFL
jgi:hypothetical protein